VDNTLVIFTTDHGEMLATLAGWAGNFTEPVIRAPYTGAPSGRGAGEGRRGGQPVEH
jgi:arylsulfatase A-like enzyme